MEIDNILLLIEDLKKEIRCESDEECLIKCRNIIAISKPYLKEHTIFLNEFFDNAVDFYSKQTINMLDYLKTLLIMEKKARTNKPLKLFDSAEDRLKQAGVAFKNNDFSGVSNKLNTPIELALKNVLNIPTTIPQIGLSGIIDTMISEKIGPIEHLKEVKKHVLMDNLVKHTGHSPLPTRAVNAIAATENLFKKLPNEPFLLSEEVKNKIYSKIK